MKVEEYFKPINGMRFSELFWEEIKDKQVLASKKLQTISFCYAKINNKYYVIIKGETYISASQEDIDEVLQTFKNLGFDYISQELREELVANSI